MIRIVIRYLTAMTGMEYAKALIRNYCYVHNYFFVKCVATIKRHSS
jgi:hypothetical protein